MVLVAARFALKKNAYLVKVESIIIKVPVLFNAQKVLLQTLRQENVWNPVRKLRLATLAILNVGLALTKILLAALLVNKVNSLTPPQNNV